MSEGGGTGWRFCGIVRVGHVMKLGENVSGYCERVVDGCMTRKKKFSSFKRCAMIDG